MVTLSWKHHTLIQALISRGPLKEKEFHTIFTGVTGRNPGLAPPLLFSIRMNIKITFCGFAPDWIFIESKSVIYGNFTQFDQPLYDCCMFVVSTT